VVLAQRGAEEEAAHDRLADVHAVEGAAQERVAQQEAHLAADLGLVAVDQVGGGAFITGADAGDQVREGPFRHGPPGGSGRTGARERRTQGAGRAPVSSPTLNSQCSILLSDGGPCRKFPSDSSNERASVHSAARGPGAAARSPARPRPSSAAAASSPGCAAKT